jgi:hypothetical protein
MLLAIATTVFASDGNADTGQRIYLKMMGEQTGLNGADFARLHTIAEWAELFDGNGEKFVKEMSKKFPTTKDYLSGELFGKHLPHIKAFMIQYAKDSGNFPSCSG